MDASAARDRRALPHPWLRAGWTSSPPRPRSARRDWRRAGPPVASSSSKGRARSLGDVTITGTKAARRSRDSPQVMQLQPGTPYFEPTLGAARDAVELEYLNLGFASAQVTFAPAVSEDRTRVDLAVTIAEGSADHRRSHHHRRQPARPPRRSSAARSCCSRAPRSGFADLLESRRRLSALGLFRRIDIRELESGPPERRDVLVTVEEAPATTVGYGGGLEVTRRLRAAGPGGEAEERIEFAPRGFFDIGRRNLGGKNRLGQPVHAGQPAAVRFRRIRPKTARGSNLSEYRWWARIASRAPSTGTRTSPSAAESNRASAPPSTSSGKASPPSSCAGVTPALRTSVPIRIRHHRDVRRAAQRQEQSLIDRLFPQVRLSIRDRRGRHGSS